MESLGEKLKAAREGKDLDFDQASKDTKIAMRYLQALENEDFSGFPGEAYITGFLRNYGAYLDLDAQELLSLYRAIRIQEQPVPVEQLLRQPSLVPKILLFAASIILVLGAVGGGAYYLKQRRLTRPEIPKPVMPVSHSPVPHEYPKGEDSYEARFYIGDTILVPDNLSEDQGSPIKLELLNLGEEVTIRTPNGPVIVEDLQGTNVNLNDNGTVTLQINISENYDRNNADMGIRLRFELKNALTLTDTSGMEAIDMAVVTSLNASTVIFNSSTPYPFTLQSNFQGYCMFRWEILQERDRRGRNEQYYQRSDELNIQAQNGIRIWASNAQAAKYQVIGGGRTVPIEIGSAGEVVVVDIRWVRDEDNRYRLIISRLESA